ncbi:MAG: permease-like cell division protein FtsX [bacterium]
MTRTAYILRELGRNLYRNPGTAVGSFLSLMLLFLLFDLYWIAAGTSDRFYANLLSELRMEVFVTEDVADSTLSSLETSLAATEGVASVTFVSREMAREELSRMVGVDLLVGYDSLNPLPCSFVLTIKPDYLSVAEMAGIGNEIENQPDIDQVYYSRRWLEKAESTRTTILNAGLMLGTLILLTALISSINNIRLSSQARAVGFRRMRLLGAGRFFLAVPFLLEGWFIGGLSAITGWLVIFYARQEITFTQFELVIPVTQEIVIYCVAAACLGIVSGLLGIGKQLK